jgi:hypothetical protein
VETRKILVSHEEFDGVLAYLVENRDGFHGHFPLDANSSPRLARNRLFGLTGFD